ncbi:MAG: guanylate kinase [Acetivibrionales bacterium]
MDRKGLLVVISAPSGTGKGTLLELIKDSNDKVRLSVSVTTRKPRENETDGNNYFFKTQREFKEMIANNELVEWVEYCDNYYGTPKKYVEEIIGQGFNVILEIEVEGAMNIRKKYPDSVLIFILPPSFKVLEKRIRARGTEEPEIIKKRLEKATKEIEYVSLYDYVIINDKISDAVDDINSIIRAELLKYERNKDILNKIGGCI